MTIPHIHNSYTEKLTVTSEIEWRIIVRSEEPKHFSLTTRQKSLWPSIVYTKMKF
jgi:hypothetical protein